MTDESSPLARDRVLAAVDLLVPAFERAGLDELELEVGELRIRLARPRAEAAAAFGPTGSGAGTVGGGVVAAAEGVTPFGEPAPGLRHVTAPLTGVWYSAPSPGARPYVTEGAEVTVGQVVGLIEAMKLFNEIKADVAGTVSRLLVESGTLVKRKQPLFEVKPG